MTKAELQAAQEAYDDLIAQAHLHVQAREYYQAIAAAQQAWEHLESMMKYERRWEGREFRSFPCIDLVLRYAPLLLDGDCLDAIAGLLKEKRSIDRHATDDLSDRLDRARETLRDALRLWRHIEDRSVAHTGHLFADLGGREASWSALVNEWLELGVLERLPSVPQGRCRLATDFDRAAHGRCTACGRVVKGRKGDMFCAQQCPGCSARVVFVILSDLPGEEQEWNC